MTRRQHIGLHRPTREQAVARARFKLVAYTLLCLLVCFGPGVYLGFVKMSKVRSENRLSSEASASKGSRFLTLSQTRGRQK